MSQYALLLCIFYELLQSNTIAHTHIYIYIHTHITPGSAVVFFFLSAIYMFEIGYRFNEFRVAGVPGAASLGSIKIKVQCRRVGYGMVCIQLLQWIVR